MSSQAPSDPLEQRILEALRGVDDPEMHVDLVRAGMVKDIKALSADTARVEVELTTPACPLKEQIDREVREALDAVEGLSSYELVLSAKVRQSAAPAGKAPIPGIRNIVAVASGKGGVGKSTVAVNLAMALAQQGARVGLMDADIYGPSVPKMLGLAGQEPKVRGERMVPLEVKVGDTAVKVMSMAFFLKDDQPVVWRGPMLHKALTQFFQDVDWGELDYLLLDLPPGTGDVQLSISQTAPIAGAVIVTTPQDVALLDVRKAVAMFDKVEVPVLGVVENMSFFKCPNCDAKHHLFGSGGGEAYAKEKNLPLLASIPLEIAVSEGGDVGRPVVSVDEPGAAGAALLEAARRVAGQLSLRAQQHGGAVVHELPVL
jgi:ATP-binding protein involved in chromosome partitioning